MSTVERSPGARKRREAQAASPEAYTPAPAEPMRIAEQVTAREQAEQTLRARAERIVRQGVKLDEIFFTQVSGESLEERLEIVTRIESMTSGKVLFKKKLGAEAEEGETASGINATYQCLFEKVKTEKPVIAYLKPSMHEARFTPDGSMLVWDEHRVEFTIQAISGEFGNDVRQYCSEISHPVFEAARRKTLARKYGLSVDDPWLNVDSYSARVGIPAGETIEREYAVSRIANLLGWKEVPNTAIRMDRGGLDAASVQESVPYTKIDQPPRFLSLEELSTFLEKPPDQWVAEIGADGSPEPHSSLTRLACLDYLVGSMDRHYGNMLIDPVTMRLYGIDNGLSLGVATDVQFGTPSAETKATPEQVEQKTLMGSADPSYWHNMRSIPLEVVLRHKEMRLSPHDHEQLKATYDQMFPSEAPSEYMQELFRFVFKDDRIMSVELECFQERMLNLVTDGRPPQKKPEIDYLPIADQMLAKWRQQEAAQEAQKLGTVGKAA
jgi:hypothetical protein